MTKLYSWNVNGLRACMEKGFREFLEREQPDVLCLQETKMQPHQAEFEFPGYEIYWNSAVKKRIFRNSSAYKRKAGKCLL